MRRRFVVSISLFLLLVVAGYACGGNGGSGDAMGGGGGGGGHVVHVGHGKVLSLAVVPSAATIPVTDGASTPAQFTSKATYADGFVNAVTANWSFDRPDIARVDGAGAVAAGGRIGGVGTLTATYEGKATQAAVTVSVRVTENPANLDPKARAAFGTPDQVPSGTLLYPYDRTVFARGLVAPELMWDGGAAGDVYLVHVSEQNYDARLYIKADPPSRLAVPDAVWTALTQTNGGDDVAVDVQRMSGGQTHQAIHSSWTIAQGSLRGAIYYWALNTGRIMKLVPGASSPVVVFDTGPADQLGTPAPANYDGTMPPWDSGGDNERCVGCHAVSKDGSTVAGLFEKFGSTASLWGTVDLTRSPPGVVQLTPYDSTDIYLAITPDGRYVVHNDILMTLRLAAASTGAAVASALDNLPDHVADPAFSPDGKRFAFSSKLTGADPGEFSRADLDVFDFDQGSLEFTNRRTVANGGSLAIAFPSFSPDSKWVFYQKGDYSRAKYGPSPYTTGHDRLYVIDVAGQIGELSLDRASGTTLEPRNRERSYQPSVNPISVGGYTWVVFFSPRDYGNRMQSTTDATTENRKQLWVAAVDNDPRPGTDPSHPAFWLAGQDLSTVNMNGDWALEACHGAGASCEQGFECCTGFCQGDGGGALTCVRPPSGCSNIGDQCITRANCCSAPVVDCIGGFCAQSARR